MNTNDDFLLLPFVVSSSLSSFPYFPSSFFLSLSILILPSFLIFLFVCLLPSYSTFCLPVFLPLSSYTSLSFLPPLFCPLSPPSIFSLFPPSFCLSHPLCFSLIWSYFLLSSLFHFVSFARSFSLSSNSLSLSSPPAVFSHLPPSLFLPSFYPSLLPSIFLHVSFRLFPSILPSHSLCLPLLPFFPIFLHHSFFLPSILLFLLPSSSASPSIFSLLSFHPTLFVFPSFALSSPSRPCLLRRLLLLGLRSNHKI